MRQCVVPLIAAMLVTGVAATGEAWAGESGGWQEKTEIMWEAASAKFVRRSFRVWDDHPELNLRVLLAAGRGKRQVGGCRFRLR